jgi:hypothetical protein
MEPPSPTHLTTALLTALAQAESSQRGDGDERSVLTVWRDQWQGYEAERRQGLNFFTVATWLSFPLTVDTRTWQETYARAALLGMTEDWKALREQESPVQESPAQDLIDLWRQTRDRVMRERLFPAAEPLSLVSTDEQVLLVLFDAFIARRHCPGHPYVELLNTLRHTETDQPLSPEGRQRISEICFLVGTLLDLGPLIERAWASRHEAILSAQRAYRALNGSIQRAALLSTMLKRRHQEETDIIVDRLGALCPSRHDVAAVWKDVLGIDKRLTIAAQKHRIWSLAFKELVDLLRPFCDGPKHLYIPPRRPGLTDSHMPQQAFERASQLMHAAHPSLWPHRPDLVKSRYYAP